ncbi:MAG: NUDIX domain-containing protein [Planctomycetota bacterium]
MQPCELIDAYRFCPRCGKGAFAPQPDRKALECAGCGYQHFINPILAAAVLISDAQGRLVLIRRRHEPSRGKLAFPGGFANAGESAEATARREVHEEINLQLGPLRYLASYPNRYEYQGLLYPTVDVFFAAEAVSLASLRAVEEVDEILLVAPREIAPEELAFDSMRQALKCLQLIV